MIPFKGLERGIILEKLIFITLGLISIFVGIYETLVPDVAVIELVLAYVALGVSFIAAAAHYRRVIYFLSVFVFLCLATFSVKFAILYSHIDNWFGALWTTVILSQSFLILQNRKNSFVWREWTSTALGVAILSLGIFGWTGWFVDASSYFPWLFPSRLDLAVSLSTFIIGTGLLTLTGIRVHKNSNHFPGWIFATSMVSVFIVSINLCIAQISTENTFLRTISKEKAVNSVSIIKESLGVYELTLKNALKKVEQEGGNTKDFSEIDFIYSVIAPDELNKVVWVDPSDSMIKNSLEFHTFADISDHDDRLIIALELEGSKVPKGTILSVFHSKNLFDRLFPKGFTKDFSFVVTKSDEVIYNDGDQDDRYREQLGSRQAFTMFHEEWLMEVWPTTEMVIRSQSVLAPTIFLVGAITSFFVGTTLYFFFIARIHAYKAQQANRAKNAFLLNMSHEVRTPLNGIIGTASLIANTDLDGKQERFVDIIEKSGKLLLNLINDILDVSSLESGNLKLKYAEVNLPQTISSVTRLFGETAADKNIELIVDLPKLEVECVNTDSKRFKQLLTNLINNALKFTSKGYVYVKVRLSQTGSNSGLLSVSVEDTGIGIDKKEQSQVFGLFTQVDQTYTKSYNGSGLGLSISRQLAVAMGGRLTVRSSEGKGASFDLQIPVQYSSSRDEQEPKDNNTLEGQSLLIVSENPKIKEVIVGYAKGWGMLACSASSIFDVIDMIQEGGIDAPAIYHYILIDADSSEVRGMELESLLMTKRLQNYARFIQLTNMGEMSKSDILNNSFVNVIYKPLTAYEFKDALETLGINNLMNAP